MTTTRSVLSAGVLSAVMMATASQVLARSFGEDVAYLKEHTDVIVLSDEAGQARVAVVPAYQGRVMTSTATGDGGAGHGYLKDDAIAAGPVAPHINVFGGEDRFWMGPEGGQYAIFFKPGDPFDLPHWQTPPVIDTVSYEVISQSAAEAVFRHQAAFKNYSGTPFQVRIDRTIRLLSRETMAKRLGTALGEGIAAVGYESDNRLTNMGDAAWTKENGLLSIWILSMFKHSPTTVVVIPFRTGPESRLGPVVNDAYFGKVPADRLVEGDGVLYFKADGRYRSKIGVSPRRARPVMGSYDPSRDLLTIAQYTKPEGATEYVNSMWEIQDAPYGGDTVNSYNDGPPEPGAKPLGPFYELESSSPAAALAAGASVRHVHRTMHLEGAPEQLDPIARKVLGVGLSEIVAALE